MDVEEDDEEFERQQSALEDAIEAESGGWDKKEAPDSSEEKQEREYSTMPEYEPREHYVSPKEDEEEY